ncbi:cation diffusion facilitator family transporter [Faecalibacterium gallinarum]|nr:cation diffusion facilitator family transporter [Faecalibacterium gallinarum]
MSKDTEQEDFPMKNTAKQTDTVSRKNPIDESAAIRKMSFVSVAGNAVLSGFKFFAGVTGNSGAMISDSIHSFSDVITTLIAWIGVKASKKEADAAHPYGHERIECIASLLLGIVLLGTGLGVGKVGLENIFSGNYQALAVPSAIALVAAVVSIVSKEAMYWYTRYYANLIHSSAFLADAWHHRSDAFSSIGSLIGIAGAMMGYPVLDSVASVVICLFIVKASYDILKDGVVKLLDTSCGESYDKKLADYISGQEGVVCVDSLRSRMFGNKVYIDLEIQVDGEKSLREAHQVAERIHDDVEKTFPDVKHIMIHLNPTAKAV